MKTGLVDKNAKFKLASGTSHINVNNEFSFIKYQNRLFRINAGSNDKRLKILDLLKEPKKLTEVLDFLSEFRKKDIIDFLRKLDSLQLLDFEANYAKNFTFSHYDKMGKWTRYPLTGGNTGKSFSSQVLLVGNGILAKKIHLYLRAKGVYCNKVTSSIILNRKNGERRKFNRNSKSLNHKFASNDYSLIIAAEDFPNIRLFETINKLCFKKNIPWLRASFDDNIGYLGPFVIPRKTSCYNCCQLRLITNSWHYEYQLWRYKEFIPETKLDSPGLFVDVLASSCSDEIVTYLTHKRPKSIDTLYVFDTTKMEISRHKVILHPSCTYCKLTLVPRHSKLLSMCDASGEREKGGPNTPNSALSEQELLQRLREIEDEKTGIVIKTQKYYEPNIFGIDFHHFYGAEGGYPLRNQTLKQNTIKREGNMIIPSPSGSGISPAEAKMHALMEMVERYSNMLTDESRLSWTTYNKVRDRAINPLEFNLYEDRLYRKKDFRCSRFSPNSTLPWLEGQDLFSGKRILLCADFIYYPAIRERPLVIETSNGAASHTNLVQAILNGLYEVIERDAFLIMWLKKLSMPIIDQKSVPFSFSESIRLINKFGMSVKLVDITSDTNVPTVMAICYNKSDKYPAFIVGAGTHIDPKKAIQKALFETELLLFHYVENPMEKRITGMNKIYQPQEHAIYYLSPGRRKHWDFMISNTKKSRILELKKPVRNNYGILMGIVKRLHSLGHKVIWVNITPPDIGRLGIKVVKVCVTGFQPLYFGNRNRLSLERLSKVPTLLGYSKKKETNLINTALHPLS